MSEEAADTAVADRKLIKTVNMDVETREYDKLLSAVENKVTELGGYIESLDAYNGSTYYSYRSTRNANLTIRIPKDRLEEFQNTVSELGNVTSRSKCAGCNIDICRPRATGMPCGRSRRDYYSF